GTGGGGMRRSSLDAPRGPDFFENGDKEVPEQSVLYDPQLDVTLQPQTHHSTGDAQPVALGSGEEQQPDKQPEKPDKPETVIAPRGDVTIESLPELGIIIIRSDNPEDAKRVEKLLETIREISKGSAVAIEMVKLKKADATSVVAILNQLYQRVSVSPSGY